MPVTREPKLIGLNDLLQRGIAAAKAGRREEARALLLQVVEADERNEQAWLWLAGVIDDPQDIRTCLENVLALNPGNVRARQGLEWVNTRYGPAPQAPPTPAGPAPTSTAQAEQIRESTPPLQPQQPPGQSVAGPPPWIAEPLPAVQQPRPAQSPQPHPEPAPQPATYPCPYCGAPTTLSQQRCAQCRNSLMVRTPPPEKRSPALTILAVLWGISAGLAVLGALMVLVGALLAFQASLGRPQRAPIPLGLLLPCVILLITAGISFWIMRGLLWRERWAYFVNIGATALSLIGALCNVAQGAVLLRTIAAQAGAEGAPPAVTSITTTLGGALVFSLLVFPLLNITLTALSYHDFFGPLTRLLPTVVPAKDVEHYNSGVAYKNRGMWYMAVKEWEAAIRKKPHDRTYLQALGLAYAQLLRRYPYASPYLAETRGYLLTRKAELYAIAPELERLNLL